MASVRIKPDLTEFRKELSAGLKSIKAEVSVQVHADTKLAEAEIAAFRKRNDGKDLTQNLVVKTNNVENQLRGLVKKIDFKGVFGDLQSGIESATNKMLSFAKAGAAFAAIQSTTQSLGPLFVQAAGAAALLPGALLGAVSVVGALKLGADGATAAFRGLTPVMDNLSDAVSASFEKSLTPAVNNLKVVIPQLKAGFQGIVTEIGNAATQFTGLLKTTQGTKALNTILGSTSQIIANLGKGLAPFLAGFIQIGAIGLPIIQELTKGLGTAGNAFLEFTQSAAGAAKIQDVIQVGIEAIKQLGQILGQVLGIAKNFFTGLTSGGGSLAGTLLPALQSINKALGSEGMQAALGDIGTALSTVGRVVGQTLGPVIEAVLPALAAGLKAATPGISILVTGLGELIKGIAPALPAVGALASVLGTGLGKVAAALGPVLGKLATVLADTLAKAIPPLIPIITDLVNIIGDILIAVAPLIAPLVELATAALRPILDIIKAIIPPFQSFIQNILSALQPQIPVIAQAFKDLGTALAPLAGALGQSSVDLFKALLPIIPPLTEAWVKLVNAILPLIPVITNLVQTLTPIIALVIQIGVVIFNFIVSCITPLIDIFGKLTTAVGSSMTGVQDTIKGAVTAVTGFFSGLLTSVNSTFTSFRDRISSSISSAASSIQSGVTNIVGFIGSLPGRISSAVGNLASLLVSKGQDVINGLINGINNRVGSLLSIAANIAKSIASVIGGALHIGSPSKVMRDDIGVWIPAGIAVGIDSNAKVAYDSMDKLGQGLIDRASAIDIGSQLSAQLSGSVDANASVGFEPMPVVVNVTTNEDLLKGFVQVQIDEGNRTVVRGAKAGTGAVAT